MFKSTRVELISEDLSACRICLATNTKLYSISDGLEDKFVELMGVEYSDDDGLPQHLCPFCRMQLLKFAVLRMRCHRSQELLKRALKIHPFLSTDNILSINRNFHRLALNLVKLSVYTFNSHDKKIIETVKTEDLNMEVSDGDNFNDREEIVEVNTGTIDPLVEDVNTQMLNKEIPKVTVAPVEQIPPKGPCIEIDGLNGKINIKNAEELSKKERLVKQYNKQQAERVEKKQKDKEKRISNLIRFVAGKKCSSGQPLTKWQMQLRRAENDYLPNFDHAEFERDHDCKLEILTTEEQLAEIEQRKQSRNYLNLDYKCETCGWGFEFERSYKNHMAKHDKRIGRGRFQCEICGIYYRTQSLKYRHLDTHKMKFTCNICSFVTRAKHLAKTHYLMHTGKVYKCKHCDATFAKSTSYLGHVRINHPSKDAVCDICGDAFVGALGLRHHKSKAHKIPKAKFKCKTCGVLFMSSDARNKHRGEQSKCDVDMRPCTECGEVYRSEELLKAHTDERHVPVQYHCDECELTFLSQASYETHHQRIHLKIKWPAYGRTREMNRQYYRKIRERSRLTAQVVCEICGAKVMSNAALERHQQRQCKRERNTKSYKCPHCEKTCATRQGLQLHTTLHTGEKPYKCSQCPLEFRQSGALKRHHKGVHLGLDTRVQCEYCAKFFSTPSTRKLHVNTVHLKMPHPVRHRRKILHD